MCRCVPSSASLVDSQRPMALVLSDPDTCIDCGACIPECPYEVIFIEEEVPPAFVMAAGQERVDHETKQKLLPLVVKSFT